MRRSHPDPEAVPEAFYRVFDALALARLVKAYVAEAGTQVKAAPRLGVSQATVSKRCSGDVERLHSGTFARLARVLRPFEALRRAVLSPDQAVRLRQCGGWVGYELRGYTTAPHAVVIEVASHPVETVVHPAELGDPEEVYGAFHVRLQYRLLDEPVEQAVTRLRDDPRYAGYFTALEKAVDRWGKDAEDAEDAEDADERKWRLALAECRAASSSRSYGAA